MNVPSASTSLLDQDIRKMIPFDQEGVFGPAMTLAIKANSCSKDSLEALSRYVKQKFIELAHVKPKGRKQFCVEIIKERLSLNELLKTRFYQSMQKQDVPPFHTTVIKAVSRPMLETAEKNFPERKFTASEEKNFKEWIAKFVEMYIPQNNLEEQCEIFDKLGEAKAKEVIDFRKKIGMEVYSSTLKKEFTEKDLDALVTWLKTEKVIKADHQIMIENFIQKYAELFTLAGECAAILKRNIATLYDTAFRNKFFPRMELETKLQNIQIKTSE